MDKKEQTTFDEKQKSLVWEESQLKRKAAELDAGCNDALKQIENTVGLARDASLLLQTSKSGKKARVAANSTVGLDCIAGKPKRRAKNSV